MNQPTLSPAAVPGRPRPGGFRAACLALLSACLFGFASAKADPGQALNFDGVDDKVIIPHRAELNSLPLTVECWFKPTASGSGVSSIVNKYVASSGNGWAIHYASGQVSGWYYAVPGFVNTTLLGVTVSLNTWHHVAMVVETTGSKLYVDGVLASSAAWSGAPTVATTTQDVTLGEYAGNVAGGKFFPGAIDEVRIWNGARSLAEIQAFKDTEIASMPSCLMAYYKFSQGVADGVNTGVTALPDVANAFADDGTLQNFALSGTTGNWTTGPTLTASTSAYAGAPDINLVGNGNPILDGTTATATGNNTDFGSSLVGTGMPKTFTLENTGTSTLTVSAISFSGANPGDYAVSGITLPATVAANASTTFAVTFTPTAVGARTATINVVSDDCDESNYDFALTGTGTPPPATALNFDGSNDSVDIPHSAGQLGYPFTVEAWVKTTDTHGLLVSKYAASSGNGWQMGTEGGKLTAWFFRPGGAGAIFPSGSGIVGATTINNNVWHHVAFVVDSTGGRLYVDGVSDGFSGWTWGTPGPATTTVPVRLGDVTLQTVYPFAGTLDEVRIWSVARSAAELQANKNTELAVMPPCLVGYYKFNQGTADGNNAGLTSLVDTTGGASGALNNFALNGPASNWTTGSGITEVTSVPDPTAPEINLTGNAASIALGDTTPSTSDHTDFGNVAVAGSPVVRTFTVENTGPGASALNVASVAVSGAHAADFTVGALTPAGPIAGGSTATFTVTFAPSATGTRTATITVNNDDCNESAYAFAVQGTGVNTAPTVIAANPTITVNEGTATSNGLTVNDAEGHTVTVTSSVGSIGVLASATFVSEFATTATPRRFDFDSAGNIYVGSASGVVTKYAPAGTQLMQFTLASPSVAADGENFTGIDVDSVGNIYVTYSGHTHTRKYDSTGNLIGNFGPATQQVYIRGGRFGGPSGNYYQLDRSHKLVLVNPSGTELWRTAGYNAGVNEPPNTGLSGNLDVAIHPTTGAAYVGDNGFIKGFDATGATTGYFSTTGGQNNSIDMDAQGNLWAASATSIRKYTTAGIALGSFGTAGTGAGQFQLVTYLRFDAAGNLWALDQTRNKLIKFNVGQSTYAWLHTPADGPAGPTTVTITATDSLGASGQTTFTLNVNNVAPTATFSRSAATANENTVTPPSVNFSGQTDPGTTDVSTGLKYSYDYNNDGTWDDGDGTYAGSLTTATRTIPASYFAAPAPASRTVKGRVLDKDGGLADYSVSITVNRTPSDVTLNPSSIAENNAANATVGTLAATDPDAGNTHTFTLVGGAGSGDNGSFTIAGNALKLTPSADFETKPTYQLRVRATDVGGLFFEKALTVSITDVAENTAPTVARDAATVTVPEGTTAFNSGTFADANGNTVTITASVGSITQSGAGAWTHQQTLTQGGNPIELTLDSQENLYVANPGLNTLYKYNSSGSLVTSWTVTGTPTGVAVDSANGWLYVVLKDGRRIDKFTLSGTLLSTWGSSGSGDGQFNTPHCVAVDAAGDVYVADSFNSRIQVFSPAGTFLRKWGTAGSGDGQFNFPQGLRISPGGTLYVADRNNNRVQYFNTAGTFLGKWGTGGSGNGQFSAPAGIGIDPGGNVVVGDIGNNRIQKFTANGTYVDKLGPSTTVGNLSLPHGTAFPPSGRSVYIADFNNGRVVKFATPGGWNWSHTPADGAAGPTTVTITATDNGSPNLSSTTTFTLNVNNVAPTIALTGAATVANGAPYTLNLGTITDPGTDTVSAFSINWGDGHTENFTGNPASTTQTHTYATLGAKTITVTLTDEDGTFTGGTKSVTVENAAPVAGADGLNRPNTTKVAKVLKSDLLGNDSDADSDPLTLTAVGNAQPPGATVAIAGNFVVYTAPANNAGNGSFTYTLSAGAHTVTGTVTVTETSTSGGGGGTPNYLTLVPNGNDFVVTFLGVPGGSFRVQYSTAGPPNYDWQEFAPPAIYTAAPNGVFTHTDVNPPGPVRFYRAIANP